VFILCTSYSRSYAVSLRCVIVNASIYACIYIYMSVCHFVFSVISLSIVENSVLVFFSIQVNFSEPLSFLQRLTEDFEYSDSLDAAAAAPDQFEQMAYVAAFTVSSYANTTVRTGKPFNPLLGETYECDRMADLGWRAFTEQVNIRYI
jgi:Oxysterol-binding protein